MRKKEKGRKERIEEKKKREKRTLPAEKSVVTDKGGDFA